MSALPRLIKPATLASIIVLAIGVTAVIAGQTVIQFFARALYERLPPIDQELVVVTAPFDLRNLRGIHDLAGTRARIASALSGLARFGLFRASYQPVRIGDREPLKKIIGVDARFFSVLGVEHLDYWSYRDELANNQRLLGVVTTATHGVALGFLLITALNAAAFVSHMVARREKEIGLKRALGATRMTIFFEVQAEVLLLGGGALLLGLGLAQLLVVSVLPPILDALTGFSAVSLEVPAAALAAGFVAGVLVPVMASMAPAIRAGNISPAVALRDD